jgi:hypothetical protein
MTIHEEVRALRLELQLRDAAILSQREQIVALVASLREALPLVEALTEELMDDPATVSMDAITCVERIRALLPGPGGKPGE